MLRTFRLPGVTSANVAALLQFSAVIPVFFFVTLHLQEVQRYSALRAGLAFLPLAGGVIVIALSASWLVGRFGPAPTLIADPLVFAGRPGLSQVPAGARTYVADVLLAWSWSRPAPAWSTPCSASAPRGACVLTAIATARTRELAAADAGTGPLAAPGHQVAAVVGGYDRASLIAAAFAASVSLVSLAAVRSRQAAPVIPSTQAAGPAQGDTA